MNPEIDKIVTVVRIRLQTHSPFFATLSLFTKFKQTTAIPTAATDGKDIYLNPDFFLSLPSKQQDGLILHELLHAALLHVIRRRERDKMLWNIAADMVVNLIIKQENYCKLPPGGVFPPDDWQQFGLQQKPEWDKLKVEEIYELLLKSSDFVKWCQDLEDLFPDALVVTLGDGDGDEDGGGKGEGNENIWQEEAKLKSYWNNANQQAVVIAGSSEKGDLPAGIERQLGEISQSQLDWRSYLWRYLVHTPYDFEGFDRRFVGRGLYLETLTGESVEVFVAVDTSGSIGEEEMSLFLGEIMGILTAYPHLKCHLYYADADVYGPYDITQRDSIPTPVGGGGTSFIPFFEKVQSDKQLDLDGVCVYLTDGYGSFPHPPPDLPVLWVVTPWGRDLQQFPFGETVRLLSI